MTVRITRPTTIVRTDAQGKVTRATNVGAIRHPMVTPTAMAKPEQAARVLQELQSALEHVADIVQPARHRVRCLPRRGIRRWRRREHPARIRACLPGLAHRAAEG